MSYHELVLAAESDIRTHRNDYAHAIKEWNEEWAEGYERWRKNLAEAARANVPNEHLLFLFHDQSSDQAAAERQRDYQHDVGHRV